MQTRSITTPRKSVTRLALLVGALALILLALGLYSAIALKLDDFIEYWAAGHLNLQGLNPYDSDRMGMVQRSLGRSDTLMVFNPPHALTIAMPFALAPYTAARLGWLLLNFAAVGLSAWWLSELYGKSRRGLALPLVLAFLFPPTVWALGIRQISGLILLGLVGFLRCEKANRPWMAGAFLALVFLKPQWMYLLWPALLVWSVTTHNMRTLSAACLTILAGTAVAVLFNPAVLRQYLQLIWTGGPIHQYLPPTIGSILRATFGAEHLWLQFLPMLFGLAWLTALLVKNKGSLDWHEQLPALVLVSALTSAYGWTFDQVVLLVALLPTVAILSSLKGNPILPWLIATGLMLIGAGLVWVNLASWWYAPAWCLWYWSVTQAHRASRQQAALPVA